MELGVDFFAGQIEEEKESWKKDHEQAMECHDLQDKLSLGIVLFKLIRRGDETWSRKVQSGAAKFDANRVRQIHDAYGWWLTPCDVLIEAVQRMERWFEVENADDFRRCVRHARQLHSVDVEPLIRAIDEMARGQVEPLTDEVWGALPDSTNRSGGEGHSGAA